MPIPDSDCLGDSLRFSRRDTGFESLEMTSSSLVIQTSYGLAGTQTVLGLQLDLCSLSTMKKLAVPVEACLGTVHWEPSRAALNGRLHDQLPPRRKPTCKTPSSEPRVSVPLFGYITPHLLSPRSFWALNRPQDNFCSHPQHRDADQFLQLPQRDPE